MSRGYVCVECDEREQMEAFTVCPKCLYKDNPRRFGYATNEQIENGKQSIQEKRLD